MIKISIINDYQWIEKRRKTENNKIERKIWNVTLVKGRRTPHRLFEETTSKQPPVV